MSINGYVGTGPDVSWWLDAVRKGMEYRKTYTHQNDWERWRKYYRGEWPRGVLPVNLFFRMLRTVVPRIYFRDPSLSVIASKPGAEQQVFAQLIERIDNKLIRTMHVKEQMKRAVHNTWMFGTGAVKVGWGAEFTPTPELFNTGAPEEFKSNMTRRVEYNATITNNMPWLMSVHPGTLIVPKGLDYFPNTPWVATWIRRSIDDVQADPRLKNVKNLHASGGKMFNSMGVVSSKNDFSDMVDLVEIRDLRTRKVIVLAPYASDRVLYFGDDELQNNNRSNIYPIIFNPDDEIFWGVPDSVILEPHQLEINEIRTLEMKHRRMSLVKLLYKDKAIDPAEIEKLLNGDVLAAVRVNGELSDIDSFQVSDIPQSLIQASMEVQADVRDVMGFSRNQAGDYSAQKSHNAPTAVEARIVQASSEIRVDERRDAIADVLVSSFEDINDLCFNRWDDEQVVQVIGPDAMPVWVAFKPEMLKAAKYSLQVEPDSNLPITKDMREAKALNVYNLLKTNPLIDPQLLTSYVLRELHGVDYNYLMRQMEQLQQNAAQGVAGSTMENPIGPEQYMQMLASGGQQGG